MFWRNSFQPVVIGDIVPEAFGSEVRVRMRLQAFVAAFVTVWFTFLCIGAGLFAARGATTHGVGPHIRHGATDGGTVATLMAGIAFFAYGLMSVFFWTEVKKARLLLRDALGIGETEVQDV